MSETGHDINQQKMEKLKAAYGKAAEEVPLVDGVCAKVKPAYMDQITELFDVIQEVGDLNQLFEVMFVSKDRIQQMLYIKELISKVPKVFEKLYEVVQPHCDVELKQLSAFHMATVCVTCFEQSLFGASNESFNELGKRTRQMLGENVPKQTKGVSSKSARSKPVKTNAG